MKYNFCGGLVKMNGCSELSTCECHLKKSPHGEYSYLSDVLIK